MLFDVEHKGEGLDALRCGTQGGSGEYGPRATPQLASDGLGGTPGYGYRGCAEAEVIFFCWTHGLFFSAEVDLMALSSSAQVKLPEFDPHGKKLFQQRAVRALPVLVRQAKAEQTIFYSDLAQELGMPNARNLNAVLGAVADAL